MQRIVWQGASRSSALQALMQQRVQAWHTEWFADRCAGPTVTLQPDDARVRASSVERCNGVLSAPAGPCLWGQWDADAPEQLGAAALALPAGAESALARSVGQQCMTALLRTLGAFDTRIQMETGEAPDHAGFLLRHGGLALYLGGMPGDIHVAVNHAWCGVQLPAAAVGEATAALVSRREAVRTCTVAVKASIALGSIDLLDSLELRVGEVLVTDVSRVPQVVLETDSGKVATGHMQHGSARRTVVLA